MDMATLVVLALGITVAISALLGSSRRSRRQTLPEFFYGNHGLSVGALSNLLLSSPFSVNGILYQVFLGYAIGIWAVVTQVAWCLSYLWLNAYTRKIRTEARLRTLHGAIGDTFGFAAERAAAIATVIGFTLLFGWEIIVGTSIFEAAAPSIPYFYWIIALGLSLVAAAYTMTGGLRGNVSANRLQNAVAALSLVALLAFLISWSRTNPGAAGPWDAGSSTRLVTVLGVGGVITNILFSLLWQFVDMSTWQGMASAKSESKSTTAMVFAAVLIFIFPGAVGTGIGMYVRSIDSLDPNTILPGILELLVDQPWLALFVLAGFVCALLSTIDGLLLSIGQAVTFDLKRRVEARAVMEWYGRSGARLVPSVMGSGEDVPVVVQDRDGMPTDIAESERQIFSDTRWTILVAAIFGSAFTVLVTRYGGINIFDLVYIVTVAQLVLFPVVWKSLRNADGKSGGGGSASIISGLLVGTVLVAGGILTGRVDVLQWVPIIALAVSAIVLRAYRGRE